MMDDTRAVEALAALAQPTRLAAFRRLVAAPGAGLPAGVLAAALGVPPNTLSTHLASLARAGLVRARREGRVVRYAADPAGIRALWAHLLHDCCGGRPEFCLPSTETCG